ncbi:MAG TPA: phenylalanine--tRNA ligase beta subunit-related protein [Candidatus Thermoplasmatota archaeon]|nr:phenylalanine--tRNA ligase beta subunit-related protein [Candidatus Thermoplasmatota archaeon]
MTTLRIDPAVRERFPGLTVAWRSVEGLTVAPTNERAEALKAEGMAHVRSARTVEALKDDPLFRAYRDFYWGLGIDPTKTRPSGEALNRRVLNGNTLPTINTFVDAYNVASLRTRVPVGAYDRDQLQGDLSLRFAAAGEGFQPLGKADPEPLKGSELVLADAARIVNFYPYRDAEPTKITPATRNAVLVGCGAPGVPVEQVQAAVELAAALVIETCGGSPAEGSLVGP